MKVSIITATYNSAATLRDTMNSVRKQTYHDIEHIIVDGLSKDDTLKVAAEFPHVSKVICERDSGIYDAMNKGIAACTGDIIAILNSDDFYAHSKVIADVVKKMEEEKADVLYADLMYVNKEKTNVVVRLWKTGKHDADSFLYGWMPPHPTFFVRKSIYEKYGVFNLQLKSAADYELMLRLIHKNKVKAAYLAEVIVKMRVGGLSNRSLIHRIRGNKEDKLAWKINDLKPLPFTFYFKPLRKIFQFVKKR